MKTILTFLAVFLVVKTWTQENYSLQMQRGHTLPVSCVSMHPELPIVATGSQDHSIIFWNTETQKQLQSINIATSKVISADYNSTGDQLLILTANGDVLLYRIANAEIVMQKRFSSKLGYILSCSFTQDPSTIAIGSNRDELFLWNISTDEVIQQAKGFDTYIGGNTISTGGKYGIQLRGAKDFQLINYETQDTTYLAFDKPNSYQFNPKSDLLAVGSTKLIASVFDVKTGQLIQQIEPNPENKCDGCDLRVFWSPDGKQLGTFDHKNGLFVWEAPFEKPLFSIAIDQRVEHSFYSNTGRYILLSNDKEIWIADTKTGKLKQHFINNFLVDFLPKFSKNDQYIFVPGPVFTLQKISLSSGKTEDLFAGANNQESNQLPYDYLDWYESGSLKHFKPLSPMILSNQRDFMLFGKVGLSVQKLDLQKGAISTLVKSDKAITALAISNNDSLLAIGDANGKLILYSLSQRKITLSAHVHSNMIFDLSFDAACTKVISCGWDGRTYETALSTGKTDYITESSNASNKIELDGQGLYYFKANLDHSITMHESDSHLEVRRFIGHTDKVNDLFYDQKSKQLYSCGQDGSVRIWDVASGLITKKYYLKNRTPALSLAKHPTSRQLYVGGLDRHLYHIDLDQHKLTTSVFVHNSGIANLKYLNEKTLAARGLDGVVKFISLGETSEMYSLYLYPNNEWLAVEPQSMQFDGTKEAMEQVHIVKGTETKNIGNLFNQYYTPGLILQQLEGKTKNTDQGRNIEDILENGIDFELAILNKLDEYFIPKKDSNHVAHRSTASIRIEFEENYKYQDILVYNNSKLVLTQTSDEEVAFRGSKQNIIIEIPLVPQQNVIDIKVIDKQQIEHSHYPLQITFDTVAAKTDLFILSLGINQYENKNYNLKYAKNDASQFVSSLEQAASSLYEQVHTFALADKKVTKENVLEMVQEIATTIGPEDVFVFYYAGHGVMYEEQSKDNDFFLVMSDITNLYGGKEMLLEKGLSSKELLGISKQIVAQKQVFFLDACQSGAALNVLATRGVSREKTLAQLARSSGTFFITASQDVEYANESSSLEHGLFTYAILELLTGKAPTYADDVLSMGELKNYVEQRVPELSAEHKTNPQYPTGYSFGNDFPIGVLNAK